jgi:hypothetical protein
MTRALSRAHARRLPLVIGAFLLVAIITPSQPTPAHASTVPSTVTDGAILNGTATLPTFPCGSAYPPGCPGSFSGTLTGVFTGVDVSGGPYELTFPDPYFAPGSVVAQNTTGSLSYGDDCAGFPEVWPISGEATGMFQVTGGLLIDNGVEWHGTTLTGAFSWIREGVILVDTFTPSTIKKADGTTIAVTALEGAGAGLFIPLNPGTADCAHILSNAKFEIPTITITPA